MSAHLRQAWRRLATGSTIYRGLQVPLPDDLRAQVDRFMQSPMEPEDYQQHYKIGPLLLAFLSKGRQDSYGEVGLGRHWTTNRNLAEIATTHGMPGVRGLGVILTATYTDDDVNPDLVGTTELMARSEDEVNIKPGAKLTITDVEIEEGALAYKYRSVLRSPMQVSASTNRGVPPRDGLVRGICLHLDNDRPDEKRLLERIHVSRTATAEEVVAMAMKQGDGLGRWWTDEYGMAMDYANRYANATMDGFGGSIAVAMVAERPPENTWFFDETQWFGTAPNGGVWDLKPGTPMTVFEVWVDSGPAGSEVNYKSDVEWRKLPGGEMRARV